MWKRLRNFLAFGWRRLSDLSLINWLLPNTWGTAVSAVIAVGTALAGWVRHLPPPEWIIGASFRDIGATACWRSSMSDRPRSSCSKVSSHQRFSTSGDYIRLLHDRLRGHSLSRERDSNLACKMITPRQRLSRMRKSFEKDRNVLTDDYEYFTASMPHAPTRQNKAAHKSEEPSERQSQGQNGKQSSDRSVG